MSFNIGDKVKIIDPDSRYNGELGSIAYLYSDEESLLVRLDRGIVRGYFISEVEMIKAVGADTQIFALAEELHKSDRLTDWPWVEIKELATDLYKAGVRRYV